MSNADDFGLLLHKFSLLLGNPARSRNTYLPGSMRTIECYEESLMLFWCFLGYNKV